MSDEASVIVDTVLKMSDSSINRKAVTASRFIDRVGIATAALAAISIGWLINFFCIVKPDRDQDREDRTVEAHTRATIAGAVEGLKAQGEKTNSVLTAIEFRLTAIDGTLKAQSDKLDDQYEQRDEQGQTLRDIASGQRQTLELLRRGPVRIAPMPEE